MLSAPHVLYHVILPATPWTTQDTNIMATASDTEHQRHCTPAQGHTVSEQGLMATWIQVCLISGPAFRTTSGRFSIFHRHCPILPFCAVSVITGYFKSSSLSYDFPLLTLISLWSWAPVPLIYKKNKSHQKRKQLPVFNTKATKLAFHPFNPFSSFPPLFQDRFLHFGLNSIPSIPSTLFSTRHSF